MAISTTFIAGVLGLGAPELVVILIILLVLFGGSKLPQLAKGLGESIIPCYAVSDAPANTIADLASTIGAERVLLGAPQRNTLIHMLRGNIIREVAALLPDDIHLLVCV